MFKFNELRQVHLEITNNCQASCPMCTRNIHGGIDNPLIEIENWTLERYKTIFTSELLNQLEAVYFCGNYGDPLMNNDLLDMIEYSVSINQSIAIRVHTNGSLRSKSWWTRLAEVMPKDHNVIFALDGLEDTHSLYRIGTNFEKVIENARAFILAGGTAEWAYIRFKHNEHQVDRARQLAKELGFQTFVMKDSSRWVGGTQFPVYNKNKEVTHYLEPSQYSEIKFIDKKVIDNYKQIVTATEIQCYSLKTKEIYITAQGLVFPCCWLGMIPYASIDHEADLAPIRTEILKQYYELVEKLGGNNSINAELHSVKDIINSDAYQSVWTEFWTTNKLITCVRSCGVMPDVFSTPKQQDITTDTLS